MEEESVGWPNEKSGIRGIDASRSSLSADLPMPGAPPESTTSTAATSRRHSMSQLHTDNVLLMQGCCKALPRLQHTTAMQPASAMECGQGVGVSWTLAEQRGKAREERAENPARRLAEKKISSARKAVASMLQEDGRDGTKMLNAHGPHIPRDILHLWGRERKLKLTPYSVFTVFASSDVREPEDVDMRRRVPSTRLYGDSGHVSS